MTENEKEAAWRQRQDDDHDRDLEAADQDDLLWEEIQRNAGLRATAAYAYARLCEDDPGEIGFREFAVKNLKSMREPAFSQGWADAVWKARVRP